MQLCDSSIQQHGTVLLFLTLGVGMKVVMHNISQQDMEEGQVQYVMHGKET